MDRKRKLPDSANPPGLLDRLLSGNRKEDLEPVDVEVTPFSTASPESFKQTIISHNLKTVSDFSAIDLFMVILAWIGITVLVLSSSTFPMLGLLYLALPWLPDLIVELLLLCYLLRRLRKRPSGEILAGMFPPAKPSDWWWSVRFYLPFFPVVLVIAKLNAALIDYFLPPYTLPALGMDQIDRMLELSPLTIVMSALSILILAPLIEEIWFRGIGLAGYRKTGGTARAIFWTSLIFGLLHGPRGFMFATVLGGVLALIRLRTGSLYCSMLVHGLHNLVALIIAYAF